MSKIVIVCILVAICLSLKINPHKSNHFWLIKGSDNLHLTHHQKIFPYIQEELNKPNIRTLNIYNGYDLPNRPDYWVLEYRKDGSVQFRNYQTGQYLAWTQDQYNLTGPVITSTLNSNDVRTRWNLENRLDGRQAIKGSNGRYLSFQFNNTILKGNNTTPLAMANSMDKEGEYSGFSFQSSTFQNVLQIMYRRAQHALQEQTYVIVGVMMNNIDQTIILQAENRVIGELESKQRFQHNPSNHFQTQSIKWYWENKERLNLPNPQNITLVSSLDPCLMCTGNILLSGFNIGSIQIDTQGGINWERNGKFKKWENFSNIQKKLLNQFGYYKIQNTSQRQQFIGPPQILFKNQTVPKRVYDDFDTWFQQSKQNVHRIQNYTWVKDQNLKDLKKVNPQRSLAVKTLKRYDLNALSLNSINYQDLKSGKVSQQLIALLNKVANQAKAKNAVAMIDKFGNLLTVQPDTFSVGPIYTGLFNIVRNYYDLHFDLISLSSALQENFAQSQAYTYLSSPKACIYIFLNLPDPEDASILQTFAIFKNFAAVSSSNIKNFLYLNDPKSSRKRVQEMISIFPPIYQGLASSLKQANLGQKVDSLLNHDEQAKH